MSHEILTARIPLQTDKHGTMRIGQTRVPLDSVVFAFHSGSSAEEIVQQFSTLDLADVYAVLGYYLRNREKMDDYLHRRQTEAEAFRDTLNERHQLTGIRERLLARKHAQEEKDASTGI